MTARILWYNTSFEEKPTRSCTGVQAAVTWEEKGMWLVFAVTCTHMEWSSTCQVVFDWMLLVPLQQSGWRDGGMDGCVMRKRDEELMERVVKFLLSSCPSCHLGQLVSRRVCQYDFYGSTWFVTRDVSKYTNEFTPLLKRIDNKYAEAEMSAWFLSALSHCRR